MCRCVPGCITSVDALLSCLLAVYVELLRGRQEPFPQVHNDKDGMEASCCTAVTVFYCTYLRLQGDLRLAGSRQTRTSVTDASSNQPQRALKPAIVGFYSEMGNAAALSWQLHTVALTWCAYLKAFLAVASQPNLPLLI
ncbi:hypothetical protein PoB_002992100 [Plakobranchus ocellatus]|uniref:Uncharacterized protein n=1 Tax=Plakobranchus ocellatus TaxID=259542 RepID=A0AAV3ZWT1_9GAST|nr:hypothetical protein PoB_002992100 [Plakobranchus ocellatus]